MEETYVINNRAIPVLSNEDIELGKYNLEHLNSIYASKEKCKLVMKELDPILDKLNIMADSFKHNIKNSDLINSDVFKANNIIKKINSIHPKTEEDIVRFKEFFDNCNWIATPYILASDRLFDINRHENYKDYVLDDFKILISVIKKDLNVEKLSDIYLSKYKFRRFLRTPKTHVGVVYNFTAKALIDIFNTIDNCLDYSNLEPEYLGSAIYCLSLWGSRDIVYSSYKNIYNLLKNTYYSLLKNKVIISPIKNIIS